MENKTNSEWAEMFQEQIQNGASQSDILQMLEEYKKQALPIYDVVGQSEQLISFLRQYQKSCEIMHVNKIDVKNFVEHYKTN